MRRLPLLLIPLLLLLGACQSQQINRDFDASRDFGAYRSAACVRQLVAPRVT